jgi:hypothetical protein
MKVSIVSLTVALSMSVVTTSATRTGPAAAHVPLDKAMRADSSAGKKLLKNALVVQPSEEGIQHVRRVEDAQQGYGGYQYGDNEYGLSGLADLYIKYKGCASFLAPDQDANGSGDGNNVNYYNYNQQQQQQDNYYNQQQQQQQDTNMYDYDDGMVLQNLVMFTLCSDSSCGSCSGEYAADMTEFLNAYTEMQMRDDEYQCEYVREHCYCQNGNNEYCYSTCYANAGLDNCMSEYYGDESFQLQEYIECRGTCYVRPKCIPTVVPQECIPSTCTLYLINLSFLLSFFLYYSSGIR